MGRYIEKKYLCKYDLSKEFFEALGLDVLETSPLRKVYSIITTEGKKILKKVDYGEDKILFIDESLKYINRSFKNTINFNNIGGKPYLTWKGENYIVMDVLEGKESSSDNLLDVEKCSKELAEFHKASLGISDFLVANDVKLFRGDNLIEKYKEIEIDLSNIKEWVVKSVYKNEFDFLFLEVVDECLEDIRRVNDMIWISGYNDLLRDKSKYVLSHNDLAHHNFLIFNEKVNIIDFDYSNIDLRINDISDFILKWIKNNTFDIVKAKNTLEVYSSINELTEDEYKLIYINLSYSKDLYSIIKSYYHKEKEWEYDSFLSKFKMKIQKDLYRKKFLEDFKEYLINKFK